MSVPPDAREECVTALEHNLGEMHEDLYCLTKCASSVPVHPPAMAPTGPVADLPTGSALEPSDSMEDNVKQPFCRRPLAHSAIPTSDASDHIRRAAQYSPTTIAQHNDASTLPLSTLFGDI